MLKLLNKLLEVKIIPTIDLPILKLGGPEDVNKVYMGIFRKKSRKPYKYIVQE